MVQSYARFVVALLVVSSIVAGTLTMADPARAQTQPDVDTTVLRIELHENTTATWELQIRTRLRTSADKTEYRAFQRQFENDTDAFLGPFSERINGTVEAANRATGREMKATGFEASTSLQSVPRQWGVVTYRFHWTNFAVERDGQLVVGDVFESGLFIAENDSFEVVAPTGYRVATATPSASERDDGVLTWDGPESFADGQPRVTFEPLSTEDESVEPTTAANGSGLDSLTGPLGAVFFVALVVAGYWWRQSSGDLSETEPSDGQRSDDGDGDTGTEIADTGTAQAVSTVDDSTPDDSTRPRDEGDSDDEDEEEEEEATDRTGVIVTDEDRVRALLKASGGRIRQKDVVTELDWSKSKVSRVLSRMEDDETIEKLRLGRENVIELTAESDDADDADTEF